MSLMSPNLTVTLRKSLEFGKVHQRRLNDKWDRILSDPFACTPHENVGKVTLPEVTLANTQLGEFASDQLKQMLRQSTRGDKLRRRREGKKIVAVGFGRGYDAEWLAEATLAGFETWWLDVSSMACGMASASMKEQWQNLESQGITEPKPVVRHGEIQSVLARPITVDLDLSSVEIWYFCRSLACLSQRSAKLVLEQIGECSFTKEANPEGHNKIQVVSAVRDYNLSRISKDSNLYLLRKILGDVSRGAQCPVEIVNEASFKYFDKVMTAFTIQSK